MDTAQTTTLAFRVEPDVADRVHRLADARGVSRSDLLREALDAVLDVDAKPPSRRWPDPDLLVQKDAGDAAPDAVEPRG